MEGDLTSAALGVVGASLVVVNQQGVDEDAGVLGWNTWRKTEEDPGSASTCSRENDSSSSGLGLTVEQVGEDDVEVLVAGQAADQLSGRRPRQAEDRRGQVGQTRLEQEQRNPLRDQLQSGQVVGLLGRDLVEDRR